MGSGSVNVEQDITICAKTFERPECAIKLIESIRKVYPKIQINIADDSKEPVDLSRFENVLHLKMPFYSGSSAGRNLALSKVKTKYFSTADDDFVYGPQTKLETWMNILESTDIDIVGGNVDNRRFEGLIDLSDGEIKLVHGSHGECGGCKLYDVVLQFWLGRTDKIRDLGGWDEDFKTQDHKTFFLRHLGKLKIAHCPSVFCHHLRKMPAHYAQYRHGQREQNFLKLMMEKFNGTKIVEFGITTARR